MPIHTPPRILMGPGPSPVSPQVIQAMSAPVLGHLDPDFVSIMDEIQSHLRKIFQTENEFTVLVAGTGMSGMEAAIVNLLDRKSIIEENTRTLVCVNGYFSGRMVDIARRAGADVIAIEKPWGSAFAPDDIAKALEHYKNISVVTIVHAETSTGVLQPMEGIAKIVHDAGALLVMDCVLSLGGVEVAVDKWGVDAAYSGSQKCLASPPGLAPLTLSARAMEKIRRRKAPVQSSYFDALELEKFWLGTKRSYHTAAAAPLYYALLEGLRRVHDEGLPARFARHRRHGGAMRAGLESLGFRFIAESNNAVPHLIAALLPVGANDFILRNDILKDFNTEVGGGLGEFSGKAWRIGAMGEGADRDRVLPLLDAIETVFIENNIAVAPGQARSAAEQFYEQHKD